MVRIAVTGASGKAGRGVVRDLLAQGYEVLAIDQIASPDPDVRVLQTDLTDYGQAAGLPPAQQNRRQALWILSLVPHAFL